MGIKHFQGVSGPVLLGIHVTEYIIHEHWFPCPMETLTMKSNSAGRTARSNWQLSDCYW